MKLLVLILLTIPCWLGWSKPWFPRHSLQQRSSNVSPSRFNPLAPRRITKDNSVSLSCLSHLRGGDTENDDDNDDGNDDDDDMERYSRQVFTLGATAQKLIRSSAVYLDGPPSSGLLYETAKNLALTGVRHLILIRPQNQTANTADIDDDGGYYNPHLDDLGRAYQRAARAELVEVGFDEVDSLSEIDLLEHYLRRLNPGIVVSTMDRSELMNRDAIHQGNGDIQRRVLVSLDRSFSKQVALNQIARQQGWSFVCSETAGVFGRIFCDFGDAFQVNDADGEMPLVTPLDRIELADNSVNPQNNQQTSSFWVRSIDGEKHDVSKGDHVEFQLRDGSVYPIRCEVIHVQNPFLFSVQMLTNEDEAGHSEDSIDPTEFVHKINELAASVRRVKVPQTVSFLTLETAMQSSQTDPSLFSVCDLTKSFDENRKMTSMACFQALSRFVAMHHRSPTLEDEEAFWKLACESWPPLASLPSAVEERLRELRQSFLRGCAAKFTPFPAFFGAIASQEAIKAATSLYFPVKQFLLYDCDEVLGSETSSNNVPESTGVLQSDQPEAGLRYLLGDDSVDRLQSQRLFVVGAGAIGCELLKNLAAMGAGCQAKGKICLTDMDTIENSNLSRQLLFRDINIGDFKSVAAQKAASRFNPRMQFRSFIDRVGDQDQTPFTEKFWAKKVGIVLNALDNMEARLYIDEQCVKYRKPLVDAGTMGPKGNVQVVVPGLSESYASSVDPPEPAIAMCTLKNFPYAISHTIQWARDLFEGYFEKRPARTSDISQQLSLYEVGEVLNRMSKDNGEELALEFAAEVAEDVEALSEQDDEMSMQGALEWAAAVAVKLFYDAPLQLLKDNPVESLNEDGEPFWAGTRRPPRVVKLATSPKDEIEESVNSELLEFVRHAARLRFETVAGKPVSRDNPIFGVEESRKALLARFESCNSDGNRSSDERVLEEWLRRLEAIKSLWPKNKMSAIDFEKDDDTNGHVAFVTAASNLRARIYGIPPVSQLETRRVAGNIVPAMITTTALVSALSCIELAKLSNRLPLSRHRNAFINLALPFFAFTVPLPPEPFSEFRGRPFTIWDQLAVRESRKTASRGGITLKKVLRKIKKMISEEPDSVEIASVSIGPFLLFAKFLHEDDAQMLKKPLWDLIRDTVDEGNSFETEVSRDGSGLISESPDFDSVNTVELTVTAEDDGDEIELPPIRVIRRKLT